MSLTGIVAEATDRATMRGLTGGKKESTVVTGASEGNPDILEPLEGERFRVRIHTRVEVTQDGETKTYVAIHDVRRCTNDRWRVAIERPGHEPDVMTGDGDIPAIIHGDGALVILIPRRG
jgi:hypothetical protein